MFEKAGSDKINTTAVRCFIWDSTSVQSSSSSSSSSLSLCANKNVGSGNTAATWPARRAPLVHTHTHTHGHGHSCVGKCRYTRRESASPSPPLVAQFRRVRAVPRRAAASQQHTQPVSYSICSLRLGCEHSPTCVCR